MTSPRLTHPVATMRATTPNQHITNGRDRTMTTTTTNNITRPAWSDPTLDDPDRGPDHYSHPLDGVWFTSAPVDEWLVDEQVGGRAVTTDRPVTVRVHGFRHDDGHPAVWSDRVIVDGETSPGDESMMSATTARRLAAALTAAADLLEADAAKGGQL